MLIHEMFQEQVLHDRRRELVHATSVPVARRPGRRRSTPSFVRTVIPAITHGLLRVPAPPDTLRGGC